MLLDTLKDAHETRLKKKFAADEAKMEAIMAAGIGESPLGMLRKPGNSTTREDSHSHRSETQRTDLSEQAKARGVADCRYRRMLDPAFH